MRLTSLLVISVLSFSIQTSHPFPLKPRAPPKRPAVQRRVAYTVVAVDGDSAATPPAVSVPDTVTIIQTSDSIETATAHASSTPPSIIKIVATQIITDAKTVDIILTQDFTKILSMTKTLSYSVVNPLETPKSSSRVPFTSQTFTSAPSANYVTSFSISTPTLSSTSTWTSVPTISMPSTSSNWASEAAHLAEAKEPATKDPKAAARIKSQIPPPPLRPSVTIFSTLPTASTKTYDDGMWHTSYPVWNATSTVLSSA